MSGDFVLGLGSNLGDRGAYLARGIERVAALPGVAIGRISRVYETEPLGPPQPLYLNAGLRLRCAFAAEWLLTQLLAIEAALGRTRELRWGPRVLDLDILWSDQSVESERLTVPHRHLSERAFALAPLLDVAPELASSYASALRAAGGAPPTAPGELRYDAARGTCVFGAALAV